MSAPSTDLVQHDALLARAFDKSRAEISAIFERDEIDALIREIGLLQAEISMTRAINQKTAAVLDAFAQSGKSLMKLAQEGEQSLWAIETNQGWTRGRTPWDAMQKATQVEAAAIQLREFGLGLVNPPLGNGR